MSSQWFEISEIETIDSPAFVVYLDRVKQNIDTLKSLVPDTERLRPHVKTHKSREITLLLMEAGVYKFKCATIAEAEMLAMTEVPDVLLAYQPTGPKIKRLAQLIQRYPQTTFSCLIDNPQSADEINRGMQEINHCLPIYIDLDVGMHRTGIKPDDNVLSLYRKMLKMDGLLFMGLHAYDGHLRNPSIALREKECDEAFASVQTIKDQLIEEGAEDIVIIVGGSPTFPIHARRENVECSPGTFIYWDKGYSDTLSEQGFLPAALVISRVISIPTPDTICIDLGHKSIASENPLNRRVFFLNADNVEPIGHSEEHMILRTTRHFNIGDVLYGIPYHVCPTCALYDSTMAVLNQNALGTWKNHSRDRSIGV